MNNRIYLFIEQRRGGERENERESQEVGEREDGISDFFRTTGDAMDVVGTSSGISLARWIGPF